METFFHWLPFEFLEIEIIKFIPWCFLFLLKIVFKVLFPKSYALKIFVGLNYNNIKKNLGLFIIISLLVFLFQSVHIFKQYHIGMISLLSYSSFSCCFTLNSVFSFQYVCGRRARKGGIYYLRFG